MRSVCQIAASCTVTKAVLGNFKVKMLFTLKGQRNVLDTLMSIKVNLNATAINDSDNSVLKLWVNTLLKYKNEPIHHL